MRIGLLSDTHSYLDERILHHLQDCDEIWHAGDVGDEKVLDQLEALAPLRAVSGNIDDRAVRLRCPETQLFTANGLKVLIHHIGGYPGRYAPPARALLLRERPGLFICGHSHILRVMPDRQLGLLHLNPGAAGRHGFHHMRTLLRFRIEAGKVLDMQAVELGPRATKE
ncbi:metallophosphoesterase family protein [Hymenobacter busanensis]|uniref:Phosphoesterase n=1 Tax=Hymenobacter busanensis TaxID=2607656 RepID=A0A7L4ZRN7_9BACT|nr:metallophosphoesterase family protein [Hymenobacter busanensis]KAA9327109.1 metallophosphoesterase family protein [Hymenobacter busanensis]QHJ05774.1 YfcE family phosphodiesterase [Hymenobacter busanensis]